MAESLVHEVEFGTLEIPGFTFLRQIGAGRGGVVLKVRQDEATLALKVLDPKVFPDEAARERVLESLRAVQALDHPNLVVPREVGFNDPHVWILTDLVEGVSLEKMLEVDGALPINDVLAITQGLLEGLIALENAGTVHGNLTLGNVLVDLYGQTRLTEAGLVPTPRKGEDPPLGASPLCHPNYLAPERILGLALDAQTDLFSVGVCVYRMLTGAWPFPDVAGAKLNACHVNQNLPDPGLIIEDLPRTAAAAFVSWLTTRDPLHRYPNAGSALADLVQIVGGEDPTGPHGGGDEDVDGDTTSGPAFDFGAHLDDDEEEDTIQRASCPYRVRLSSRGMTLAEIDLDQDRAAIGRSPQSAIHIDNPIVSRRHAEIQRQGHTFIVASLSATNHTVVNGDRVVDSVPLHPGDLIVISDKFHLEVDWDPRIRVTLDDDPTPPRASPRPEEPRSSALTRPVSRPTRPVLEAFASPPTPVEPARQLDAPTPVEPARQLDAPTPVEPARQLEPVQQLEPPLVAEATAQPQPRQLGNSDDANRSAIWRAPRGYLAFARGGNEVRSFVSHGFQVGSSAACELRLSRDLPRKAALVVRGSDGYRLYNVSPEAGAVTLNDEPLSDQAVLEPGDRILVYGQVILFDIEEAR
ncbi:MAG: protein kinase [Planctomycetes bacterium]|nr:protein kinase [Planctomycetota bacterium]